MIESKIGAEMRKERKRIHELFAGFDGEYVPESVDWGVPVGNESEEYRVIIALRPEITGPELADLRSMIEAAFKNRAGSVIDTGDGSHRLLFAGREAEYGCIQLGMLALDKIPAFKSAVAVWQWEDPDPDECCDLLTELSTPVF